MTPKILRLRLGCCLCYIPLNLRYSVLIIVLLEKKKKKKFKHDQHKETRRSSCICFRWKIYSTLL